MLSVFVGVELISSCRIKRLEPSPHPQKNTEKESPKPMCLELGAVGTGKPLLWFASLVVRTQAGRWQRECLPNQFAVFGERLVPAIPGGAGD